MPRAGSILSSAEKSSMEHGARPAAPAHVSAPTTAKGSAAVSMIKKGTKTGTKTGTTTECKNRQLNGVAPPAAPIAKKKKKNPPQRKPRPPVVYNDPKVPFPATSSDFSGVPPDAMTECLAVWHMLAGFGAVLRIDAEVYLDDFQQALVHPHSSPLLATAYERLVAAALLDPLYRENSAITPTVTALDEADSSREPACEPNNAHTGSAENELLAKAVKMKSMPEDVWKPMTARVLRKLVARAGPVVEDNLSLYTCRTLLRGEEDWDNEQAITPFTRLSVLMALADAAVGVDVIRNAIDHDMEAAAETRRLERDELSKARKSLMDQAKSVKEELGQYRKEHDIEEKQSDPVSQDNADYALASARIAEEAKQARLAEEAEYESLSRQQKLSRTREKRDQSTRRHDILKGELVLMDRSAQIQKRLLSLRAKMYPSKGGSTGAAGHAAAGVSGDEPLPGDDNDADTCGFRVRPLGCDRLKRAYFYFHGEGRVFIQEQGGKGAWSYLESKEALDALFPWFNEERVNERRLKSALMRIYEFIVAAMRKRASRLGLGSGSGTDGRRRSGRKRSEPVCAGFMSWTNNWQG